MLQTPGGGVTDGAAATDGRPMSIGAVLNALRTEFPEVTISKIRFLEAEGLVEPERTPSGYRKFRPADVARLAQVLRMQRDHYLPLRVIREHLDALERGEPPPPVPGRAPERALGPSAQPTEPAGPGPARVGRAELLAATGADDDKLAEWESYGLVTPLAEGEYDAGTVRIAELVAELARFGIEARHLRALKASAEREAGLVEQVVAPLRRHRNPQTRAHAEATAREIAGLTERLHSALVGAALGVRLP